MKKITFTLTCIIIVLISHAQVGLLSTNNKMNKSTNGDTVNYLLSSKISGDNKSDLNIQGPDTTNFTFIPTADLIEMKNYLNQLYSQIETNAQTIQANLKKKDSVTDVLKKSLEATNQQLQNLSDSLKNVLKEKNREYEILLKVSALRDSIATGLLLNNYQLTYNVFKSTLDSFSVQIKNVKDQSYKNYLLARDYKSYLDSSKIFKDKNAYQNGIAEVQMKFVSLYEDIKNDKTELTNLSNRLENVKINELKDGHNIYELDSILKVTWKYLSAGASNIDKKIKNDTSEFARITNEYNNLIKEQVLTKEIPNNQKESEYGALPQATTILGKREVITQLQLYGSYSTQTKNNSFEANLGLSFSPSNSPDTSNLYDIFIPTASKFLIFSNFTYGFWTTNEGSKTNVDSAKRLGIKFDFAIAGKNLIFDTTKTAKAISSTVFYAKSGLEFGVIPKRLSIYGNVNTVTILDKIAEFQAATGLQSKFYGYLDCGAKFYLDPTPNAKADDGLYIYSNINCIINSGDVKRITKSNDLVIPSIQIGLVKRLGKF
ncbi:MAG TPA: hypothetical protein PLP23_08295 [Panacibacter sp.]|nr:hypothetical protein [Panacibacter sp.]